MAKTSEPIIKEAIERLKESEDGTKDERAAYQEDITFGRLGDQWPSQIKDIRRAEGRPCLTINRLPSFLRQVINDARQNKPAIVVAPVDNGADPDTAEGITGLVRSIS